MFDRMDEEDEKDNNYDGDNKNDGDNTCDRENETYGDSKKQLQEDNNELEAFSSCLLYTSPSPRDGLLSRMPSSA